MRRLPGIVLASLLAPAAAHAAEDRPEWLPEGSLGTALPLLADPGGLRSALWEKGVKFQINYIGEVLGNTTGGLRTGSVYGGRLELVVDADLQKAVGWNGASFHANAYQIHGTGLSRDYVGNLMPVSNIEALPGVRLYEAWIEQKLMDGKVGVRFGQLGADTEFVTSTYAGLFINGTFGWPTLNAADLPSGGPAYPLATPGVRLGLYPTDNLTLLVGLFNGDPAGPGTLDPQRRNRYGVNFRVNDPPFLIGEAQFKYGDDKSPSGLSGTVKLGAWTYFGRFSDNRYDTANLSLADPASNGLPLQHRGDSAVYGVIDQQVYRLADDPTKGIGIFARASAAPSDRNLVDLYMDAGINFTGMIAARPDDAFGLSVAYTRVSGSLSGLDRDTAFFSGTPGPVRSSEVLLEATYSAQIVPGWILQPDFQYIVRPGANAADPLNATRALRNAVVFGLRSTLKY